MSLGCAAPTSVGGIVLRRPCSGRPERPSPRRPGITLRRCRRLRRLPPHAQRVRRRREVDHRRVGVAPWTNTTNPYLLQAADQSSTCLVGHAGPKLDGSQFLVADLTNTTAPTNRTPGGDFGWLQISFGSASPGPRHGHNVSAADFGLEPDPDLTIAPGGTYKAGAETLSRFNCISCHDPHARYRVQGDATAGLVFAGPFTGSPALLPIAASGSYGAEPPTAYAVGAYRLLGGRLYAPASNNVFPFAADPPIAVAPMTYNSSEAAAEVRVSYGTGMSEWCQNCHTDIHLDNYTSGAATSTTRHPAGSDAHFRPEQADIYNRYVSSGTVDMAATSKYSSLVPFEQGKDVAIATLRTNATPESTIAAGPTSNVMCLSSHRAHASAFDSVVRWDQNATFLTDAENYAEGASTRTLPQTIAGYYDRPPSLRRRSAGTSDRFAASATARTEPIS